MNLKTLKQALIFVLPSTTADAAILEYIEDFDRALVLMGCTEDDLLKDIDLNWISDKFS